LTGGTRKKSNLEASFLLSKREKINYSDRIRAQNPDGKNEI
jgi:hypothetical protein